MERLLLILVLLGISLWLVCFIVERFGKPLSAKGGNSLSKVIVWLILILLVGRIIMELLR